MESLVECIEGINRNFRRSCYELAAYVKDVSKFIPGLQEMPLKLVDKFNRISKGEELEPPSEEAVEIEFTPEEVDVMMTVMQERLEATSKYPNMLIDMAFIYLVAFFDAYLTDIFTVVLINRPEALKSNKQLTYKEAIDLLEAGDLVTHLANTEISQLSYRSLADQNKYYKDKFNIDLAESGVSVSELIKIRATRNLLVHNRGIVNQIYLDLVKDSDYRLGDRVELTVVKWEEYFSQLLKVADHVTTSLLKKFGND